MKPIEQRPERAIWVYGDEWNALVAEVRRLRNTLIEDYGREDMAGGVAFVKQGGGDTWQLVRVVDTPVQCGGSGSGGEGSGGCGSGPGTDCGQDYYPAEAETWDAAACVWTNLGEAYVMDANARGLLVGRRYWARAAGSACVEDVPKTLYVTDGGFGPPQCQGQGSGAGSGGPHGPVWDVVCTDDGPVVLYEEDV